MRWVSEKKVSVKCVRVSHVSQCEQKCDQYSVHLEPQSCVDTSQRHVTVNRSVNNWACDVRECAEGAIVCAECMTNNVGTLEIKQGVISEDMCDVSCEGRWMSSCVEDTVHTKPLR